MLKNIAGVISPELLKALCELGHGDEFTIADGNFPCYGICDRVIRADGHGTVEMLREIMKLIPLDSYAPWNVAYMQHCPGDEYPKITDTYTEICRAEEGDTVRVERLERFAFYEQAKKSRFVIATGEGALYANIILKKGVVK